MVLNGRAADPPSAAGFFLRLFIFILVTALFIRGGYWLIGPLDRTFLAIDHLVRLLIFGPFFVLAIYPIILLAYDTLTHFVPTPPRRARSWKEATRRKAEANAACAAFTSAFFIAAVLILHWLVGRIEDPISLTLLCWTYWLSLVYLTVTAGAALLGFYVARRRV